MPKTNQLYFEKISKYDRRQEPVTVSIPFARGKLDDPAHLAVYDGAHALPLQRRALARWPDGSVKWLLVHLQPDLPGNADHALRFEIAAQPFRPPAPEHPLTLTEDEHGIHIDTGPLAFTVPRRGFLPLQDASLDGRSLWTDSPFDGFTLGCGQRERHTADGPVELEIEEAGPLRAVVLVYGKHYSKENEAFVDLRGRVTAYAGKPYTEIEYGFFHCEDAPVLRLTEIALPVRFPATTAPRMALGEGYYRTRIQESPEEVALSLTAETILYQSNEHFVECFYGDFWVDWRSEAAGLAVSLHKAHQNFPKSLRATPGGIDVGLYPADAPPVDIYQGVGKTHRLLLHFHDGQMPLEEISTRSLQFQLPDRPALTPQWFQQNNPWGLDLFPDRVPGRIMTRLIQMHDSRPEALGMLHFGDAPDAGYTDQGRGRGSTVWVNNEYDRAHACTLFYALTGERRALEAALVAARHWLDVDLCHYSPNPLHHGGLRIHTAHHVTGGVTPSHEWVEGFLDYYYLTGRQEGMEGATMVAENILRHLERPHMQTPGAAQAREGGWALRAMVPMYQATGEARYRKAIDDLVELFLQWPAQYGGMLAPYTSHSMPRVPFMIAIALNSLTRYLSIEDNQEAKQLIVATVDDLLAHCLGADGILYYKELPSLRRYAPTVHAIEAFTYAYRFSSDVAYLRAALRQFDALFNQSVGATRHGAKRVDEGGAVIRGSGGGRGFAASYTSLIAFVASAEREGLLDAYEYPT
jgi:hypothetical protein